MEPSPASVACGSVKCLPMAKTVIRVMFDDATAAAWKIRHGERRGFEDGLWDAQAQNRDGRWVVIARRASKRRSIPGEGMDPLF